MSLQQVSWRTFAGDSLHGQPPPQLLVDGPELTREQEAAIIDAWRLFKMAAQTSAAMSLQADRRLLDGTRLRMESRPGHDRVLVQTVAPAVEQPYAEFFRAIPANETNVSGAGAKPSKGWKLPGHAAEMPATLKDVSALADHPGHVLWSNPLIKFGGRPITVTWRGPRDRYSLSTGWSGSTIVAHEEASFTIGGSIFKDSGYVWINDRRIDTGLVKVAAACICRPDPIGDPTGHVLRVCSDRVGTSRGYKVVDLAPGGAPVSLKTLCEAKTLAVVNTYTATDFNASPSGSQWNILQRPHFNASGTQLATIIAKASGTFGAIFDATTWAIDSTVDTPTSQSLVLTQLSATQWTSDSTNHVSKIVAMDFDVDSPVYLHTYLNIDTHEDGSNGQGAGAGIHVTDAVDREWGIVHSSLGTLFSSTQSTTDEVIVDSAHNPPTSGSYTRGATPDASMQFIGDLARGTFAVGYTTAIGIETATGTTFTYNVSITGTNVATNHETRLTFDVYLDNVLAASGTTGAFTNAAGATSLGDVFIDYPRYNSTPSSTSTSSSTTGGGGVSTANSNNGTPGFGVQYKHCAVHPLRKAAYLGGLFYLGGDTPARTSTPRFGLEIAAFDPPSGVVTDNPPAYAGGTYPTLSAPVFTGLQPT